MPKSQREVFTDPDFDDPPESDQDDIGVTVIEQPAPVPVSPPPQPTPQPSSSMAESLHQFRVGTHENHFRVDGERVRVFFANAAALVAKAVGDHVKGVLNPVVVRHKQTDVDYLAVIQLTERRAKAEAERVQAEAEAHKAESEIDAEIDAGNDPEAAYTRLNILAAQISTKASYVAQLDATLEARRENAQTALASALRQADDASKARAVAEVQAIRAELAKAMSPFLFRLACAHRRMLGSEPTIRQMLADVVT
jgi:hypothetical protein